LAALLLVLSVDLARLSMDEIFPNEFHPTCGADDDDDDDSAACHQSLHPPGGEL
jgi:hypothetical protein